MLRGEPDTGLAMWHKMVEVHQSVRTQAGKQNPATPTSAVSFNLFFDPDGCMRQNLPSPLSYIGAFPKKTLWTISIFSSSPICINGMMLMTPTYFFQIFIRFSSPPFLNLSCSRI